MVTAIGPMVSRVQDSGVTPPAGYRPGVGRNPQSPVSAAGMRTEPPVSVPRPMGVTPAALSTRSRGRPQPAARLRPVFVLVLLADLLSDLLLLLALFGQLVVLQYPTRDFLGLADDDVFPRRGRFRHLSVWIHGSSMRTRASLCQLDARCPAAVSRW